VNAVYSAACSAHAAGLCVLPPREDGTKAPDVESWTRYQTTAASRAEIEAWYGDGRRSGIGCVTGAVSGNLEVLDFDCLATYHAFVELAIAAGLGELIERIEAGWLEETPGGGRHWSYRCDEIAGNTKLARRLKRPKEMRNEHDTTTPLIETRGQGGYIVVAPSNGRVHPSGRPYRTLRGSVQTIASITPEERAELHMLARSLDAMPKQPPREPSTASSGEGKPGEDYNACGDVLALLEEHGWNVVYTSRDGVVCLRRPGKDRGTSATFGIGGTRYLYVFSTSTVFEAERAYSPFAVYAILEHGGDFTAAAQALASQGYGEPAAQIATPARDRARARAQDASAAILAPAFPLDTLPPKVRAYVEAAADSLRVPPDMVAVPLLGLAGALIGNRLHLVLKNSWREYLTLYLAIVARPGAAKTPALGLAQWPLDALQKAAYERYTERMAVYDDELEAWRQSKNLEKPEKPQLRHYFSTDLTVEALAGMLAGAPGVAIIRDEISGWVAAMDQYKGGKGSDRQQFLSLWSAQTLKVDRKGSGGSVYVPKPVVCVVGGIQPDLVGTLHDAARRRDGFVERVLPLVPDVEPALWTDAAPSTELYRDVQAVFEALDRLERTDDGYGVNLSPEALESWKAWVDENAGLVKAADGLAEGFYAKLPAHVARFALILHALWNPHDPRPMLNAARMEDAIELGEFFRAHIGRFLALLNASAPASFAGLATRIERILRTADNDGGWIARAEIYRRLGNITADELTAALDRLVETGKVERRIGVSATKRPEQYRLSSSQYSHNPGTFGQKAAGNGFDGRETTNTENYKANEHDDWTGGEEGIL
jgi:hypothetical protein